MKKNIVWLASYPKSGNTWFRIFLSNLMNKKSVPIGINNIQLNDIFSSRNIFEKATGIDPSYLKNSEKQILQPNIFRYCSSSTDDFLFVKAHDAYTFLENEIPIFPTDVSYGAIYFVRNPLDVAVSFAFHSGKSLIQADKLVNNRLVLFETSSCQEQLSQQLLTWSEHVESWINNANIPIVVLRYEDMLMSPLATFKKAIQFLNWNYSDEAIMKALDQSSFKSLKKQEKEKGFIEKTQLQNPFFRSGKTGDWINHLTSKQIEAIKEKHHQTMSSLGYL